MNISELANPHILKQPVYKPGKPIEQVAEEHGLPPECICKLASNENPLGPSLKAVEAAKVAMGQVRLYPEGGGRKLCESIASERGLDPRQIVLGNGSNEIIELLGHVFLSPGDEVVTGKFSFVVYKLVAKLFGAKSIEAPMPGMAHDLDAMSALITERTKLVFLPSPNNPTGTANTSEEILRFAKRLPEHVIFCLDEAYAEYLENPPDLRPLIAEGKKIVCLRTFSKIFGLAGLRIGYGYSSEEMAALLHRARQPFNANAIAQAAALAALEDKAWTKHCRNSNSEGILQLQQGFETLGIDHVPSRANFVLARVGRGEKMFEKLQKRGVIARPFGGELSSYLRITSGTKEENDRALTALGEIMSQENVFC